MPDSPLPWHRSQWQQLNERRAQGRFPHALLLTGPEGVGKSHFARQFAQSLLCNGPLATGQACGDCRACLLVRAGSHPDLSLVSPLEGKKSISVDQVRGVGHYLSPKPQYGRHKVVVVSPADSMNVNAANSLLKTLEEPNEGSVLILTTSRPAQLPATIRSRCQELRFGEVVQKEAAPWLKSQLEGDENPLTLLALAGGAPLKALRMADKELVSLRKDLFTGLERLAAQGADPISLANQWVKADTQRGLYWMYSWITDMVRLKATAAAPKISNEDMVQPLARLAAGASLQALLQQQERVVTVLRQEEQNLNLQLLLEDLLIEWRNCFAATKQRPFVQDDRI